VRTLAWAMLAAAALVWRPQLSWLVVAAAAAAFLAGPGSRDGVSAAVVVLAAGLAVGRSARAQPGPRARLLVAGFGVAAVAGILGAGAFSHSPLPPHLLQPGWGGVWMVAAALAAAGWPRPAPARAAAGARGRYRAHRPGAGGGAGAARSGSGRTRRDRRRAAARRGRPRGGAPCGPRGVPARRCRAGPRRALGPVALADAHPAAVGRRVVLRGVGVGRSGAGGRRHSADPAVVPGGPGRRPARAVVGHRAVEHAPRLGQRRAARRRPPATGLVRGADPVRHRGGHPPLRDRRPRRRHCRRSLPCRRWLGLDQGRRRSRAEPGRAPRRVAGGRDRPLPGTGGAGAADRHRRPVGPGRAAGRAAAGAAARAGLDLRRPAAAAGGRRRGHAAGGADGLPPAAAAA
ncbi:MAG: hypothetical protein H6Q02_2697, partial [Acidobacteria bacterium]|nr:hypothetical protein [Acidobacteriota bacterium]